MLAIAMLLLVQDEIVKEKDYEFDRDPAVAVRSVCGAVRVRGWDKEHARLKTTVRGRDRELIEWKIDAGKDRLEVEERWPEGRHRTLEVEIEIDLRVPRALKSLALSVVSGSVDADDVKAPELRVNSVSGSVRLARARGDLTLSVISGSVALEEAAGKKASLTLTSGSLKGGGAFDAVELSNVSGSTELDLTPPKEGAWRLDVSAISGDVTIRLPASAGARLKSTSLSGDLRCDFRLKDEKRRDDIDRSLSGTFGDGSGTIHAQTISADVRIEKSK
jgi:hypothetical protein